MRKCNTHIGEIRYDNKFGPFEIINDLGIINSAHMVSIRFINKNMFGHNTELPVRLCNAIHANIFDPYQPLLYNGTACRGIAKTYINNIPLPEYITWINMMKHHSTEEIDIKWRCYEYFTKDLPLVPGYQLWINNPSEYFLCRNKSNVYSLNTTIFINNKYAQLINVDSASDYHGVSKNGNKSYGCMVNGIYYGSYTTPEAAANKFNFVAKYRNYPDVVLNDIECMTLKEIEQFRSNIVSYNGTKLLYRLLDPKNEKEEY